jgi:hypothetical protein
VDLVEVVKGMRRHKGWLHYVGLATSRTIKHAQLVLSKYKVRVATVTADTAANGEAEDAHTAADDTETDTAAATDTVAVVGTATKATGAGGMRQQHKVMAVVLGPLVATEDSAHAAVLRQLQDASSGGGSVNSGGRCKEKNPKHSVVVLAPSAASSSSSLKKSRAEKAAAEDKDQDQDQDQEEEEKASEEEAAAMQMVAGTGRSCLRLVPLLQW